MISSVSPSTTSGAPWVTLRSESTLAFRSAFRSESSLALMPDRSSCSCIMMPCSFSSCTCCLSSSTMESFAAFSESSTDTVSAMPLSSTASWQKHTVAISHATHSHPILERIVFMSVRLDDLQRKGREVRLDSTMREVLCRSAHFIQELWSEVCTICPLNGVSGQPILNKFV